MFTSWRTSYYENVHVTQAADRFLSPPVGAPGAFGAELEKSSYSPYRLSKDPEEPKPPGTEERRQSYEGKGCVAPSTRCRPGCRAEPRFGLWGRGGEELFAGLVLGSALGAVCTAMGPWSTVFSVHLETVGRVRSTSRVFLLW